MTDPQHQTRQLVEVRVPRIPGPKLAPEDFARRLLDLCEGVGISASLDEAGTGVDLGEGLVGSEADLADDLVAILQARFQV
jgi:hypothetical protein